MVGYDKHDPMGRNRGNSRNGARGRTVLTEAGLVQVAVPRDRDGSFATGDSPDVTSSRGLAVH
jgi:putative transposase